MTDSSSDRNPVEELAEEFLARFRRGERPALSEYTHQYPDLAEQISDLFPALLMLEDVRPATVPDTDAKDNRATSLEGQKLERLGDYRILREVGRGGMGIVYEAEQVSLGRHVALKVLPAHILLDPRQLQRFQREARAAARLHHTNIVPVFGVGECDGLHYYAMQFIPGQGLDQVLVELQRLRQRPQSPGGTPEGPAALAGEGTSQAASVAQLLLSGVFASPRPEAPDEDPSEAAAPGAANAESRSADSVPVALSASTSGVHLPGQPGTASLSDAGQPYWRGVARIGIQVAEALAYAHSQGVLHRDIKPSNLLLDTQGIVWVTDFGLAKASDSEDLTYTGDVVGTLRYMAPERFQGHADPRSDVYALGLALYELLTLRPAFDQSERNRLLAQVLNEEPTRPRKLNPAVPRDLETIVLKAMSRDAAHRYPNAGELADDLKRFVDDQPIQARPVSEVEKVWRWCRRNPSVALFAGAFLLTLVLGLIGIGWKWREAEAERRKVVRAEHETSIQRDEAIKAGNKSQRVLAGVMLDRGIALADQGEVAEGLVWMLEALKAAPEDDQELKPVIRTNLAAWLGQTYRLLWRSQPSQGIWRCAFSSNGQRFLTAGEDGLRSWDAATGRLLASQPKAMEALMFSPDGTMLLTRNREGKGQPVQLQRWDTATGQPIGAPLIHPQSVCGATFTPDGKQFVTGCHDRIVRLWDAATGQLLSDRFKQDQDVPACLAISPDGRTLAVGPLTFWDGDAPRTCSLWDLSNGRRLGPPMPHQGGLCCVAFSPDGKRLVTGSRDNTAQLWDVATGKPVAQPLRHPCEVRSARFLSDGRTLATGGEDGIVRWWDSATGAQLIGTISLQKMPVNDLAFRPDGRTLGIVSGRTKQGAIQVCQVPRDLSRPASTGKEGIFKASWVGGSGSPWWFGHSTSNSPDATRVLTGGNDGSARLYDASTGQPVSLGGPAGPLRHSWQAVQVTAYSPDGRFLATSSRDVTVACDVRLWEASTGRLIASLPHGNHVSAMDFSPDSKVLATGDYNRTVHFWDTATGQRIGSPLQQVDIVVSLAFSPDGKVLAVGHAADYSGAKGVVLWDPTSRRQIGQALPGLSHLLRFSPDGQRLLTAEAANLQFWDCTGQSLGDPITEPAEVNRVAFRPDGRLLLVGALDGTLRLRDADTGRQVGAPMFHPSRVESATFSPDPEGRFLLAGYKDGSARLWDRATQKPLGPPVLQGRPILAVAFTPPSAGGLPDSFLTTAQGGSTRLWRMPAPLRDSPDRLEELALQVLTGLEMGEGQTVVPLSPEAWEQHRQEWLTAWTESQSGDQRAILSLLGGSLSDRAFHDARARDAEQDGDTFGALWHLDHLIAAQGGAKEGEGVVSPSSVRWLSYARRARVSTTLGQFDRAEADYAQALTLGSRDQLLNWYRHRIVDCLAGQKWQAVRWYVNRVLAATPDDWQLYADRARAHEKLGQEKERDLDLAQAVERATDIPFLLSVADDCAGRGQWDQAEAALIRASALGPLPLGACQCRALLCLKRGDQETYRTICGRLLEAAGPTPSAGLAKAVAWICVLGPDAVADSARPVLLAERAVSQAPPEEKAAVLNTLGAVLYRAGRYRDAVGRLREAIQAGKGQGGVHDWLFLALAHQRLDEKSEARSFLARVAQQKSEAKRSTWDKLEVEILRREAEALIQDKAPDPK